MHRIWPAGKTILERRDGPGHSTSHVPRIDGSGARAYSYVRVVWGYVDGPILSSYDVDWPRMDIGIQE